MSSLATKLLAAAIILVPTLAPADPKPRNAELADSGKIAGVYAGKTDIWEQDCQGGIYFSPNWQVRAWCSTRSDNLGVGTWRVEADGRVCYEISWYWPEGSGFGSAPDTPACISHVSQRWGQTWRKYSSDSEWWPMGEFSGLVRGYKFQNQVNATQSKLGL